MIDEQIMNRLLDSFEAAIAAECVNCMCVNSREEFQRKLFERQMLYDGFVIVRSKNECGIFYVDTSKELFYK